MNSDKLLTGDYKALGENSTRVLIVDDETASRELLAQMLVKGGYVVRPVSSGCDALNVMRQEPFDIVLLDIVMPEMDGFECLELIRKDHAVSKLPVIMVTDETDRNNIVAAFRAGANDYITRPFDYELALARIGTHAKLRMTLSALRASEERYALAARGSNDGLWDWDVKQGTVYYSPRWKAMLGYSDREISDSASEWTNRVHPDDLEKFYHSTVNQPSASKTNLECEIRMLHRDGGYRWMLCRGVYVRNGSVVIYRLAGSLTDITEGKVGDALTGLPNRLLFVDRLERAIEKFARFPESFFAVMFLDLDNFKLINDSLGHQAGDRLLITIARRLEACLRTSDSVCRLHEKSTLARHAGDEFTVLLEALSIPEDVEIVANRVLTALSEPIDLEGQEIFPTVSIGWAVGESPSVRAEDLLREADTAMYHAKREGRNRHRRFEIGMQHRATMRLQLEKDLRHALAHDEFYLNYQPIIGLESSCVMGFETLVRWRHPTKGLVPPQEFISTAEETGLIVPLGWWITEKACEQAALWEAQYYQDRHLFVTVNCAVKQLYQPDFLNQFKEILERTGANPHCICIEVTESTLMDRAELIRPVLIGLRDMGVRIGIDDFGTGYSSLAYLHRFPLDMLKVDRSFINTMLECNESFEIVRTIVDLGHNLRLKTVAEGVETETQRSKLAELGCKFAQGYLWSPPVNHELAVQYMLSQPSSRVPCAPSTTEVRATSLLPA